MPGALLIVVLGLSVFVYLGHFSLSCLVGVIAHLWAQFEFSGLL